MMEIDMSARNTDEVKKIALDMWNKNFTGGQIAQELCLTRNTVMGILHRLKKTGEVGPRPKLAFKINSPKMAAKTKKLPPVFIKAKPVNHMFKKLMQLRADSCRYIVNDGHAAHFLFCGKPKEKGSYCMDHAKLCYIKSNKTVKPGKEKISSFSLRQLMPGI
jgi:hypothetical protein